MSASVFYAGYDGTAAVGSNELSITQWAVNPSVQLVEFKNSRSGPMVVRQATFGDVSGSASADFDFGNNPFAAPFSILPGTIFTNFECYLHQSAKSALDGPLWAFASIIVQKINNTTALEGKVSWSFDWMGAGGLYTPPVL